MKFRKKPVVIEAYRLPSAGEDVPHSFYEWVDEVGFSQWESDRDEGLLIKTLEGVMRADPCDWIIKGVAGEFYPCKPDIFAATYEPVSDDAPAAPQAEPKREPLTKAAQDVLAERRRQIEVEGWTLEHDDEHSLGEIAALAAFYAVPDGVHEWDFSSTGHGNTLAEALLPSGWTAKAGEDRRRDLVKAGALILAEIERLDRMGDSDAE